MTATDVVAIGDGQPGHVGSPMTASQPTVASAMGKDESMSVGEATSIAAGRSLKRQVPSFVAVGAFGYVVDAGITYLLARKFGVDPLLARPPAFAVATVLNFALNRALTFAGAKSRLLPAFARYVLVCGAGLVVNYSVYALCVALAAGFGVATTPAMLPLFVAAGSCVAMFVTFFGFRMFAFRA